MGRADQPSLHTLVRLIKRVLIVALTGGIGCGKSAVSARMETLGVPIIDADHLAHQLVQPGTPSLLEIKKAFGERILDIQGRLDRSALREIVFNQPLQRKRLESILHPRISEAMESWLKKQTAQYVVLVIPLLFETNQQSIAHRILVVDCKESTQIERVVTRDQLPIKQVKQIIASQVNRQFRLEGADDIIENEGTYEALTKSTDKIHQFYLDLAKEGRYQTP